MGGPPPGPPPNAAPEIDKLNGAIRRAQILPGNIGYLEINGVPPFASKAIDAAFAFLKNTDALILDLRGNGGGAPETVAYYMSYLSEGEPYMVLRVQTRHRGTSETHTTNLGDRSYGTRRPVYVLTSYMTFSGGEELAYDIQGFKRGLVVGETTGGGANPGSPQAIGPEPARDAGDDTVDLRGQRRAAEGPGVDLGIRVVRERKVVGADHQHGRGDPAFRHLLGEADRLPLHDEVGSPRARSSPVVFVASPAGLASRGPRAEIEASISDQQLDPVQGRRGIVATPVVLGPEFIGAAVAQDAESPRGSSDRGRKGGGEHESQDKQESQHAVTHTRTPHEDR
nr:interphotoreceptor retinoid-binding protein [uncultured bacterium]